MVKVGIGFDVHPFQSGESLIIGGVNISADRGLAGHSDADVLTHALIDALLGAAGAGDIGQHFPDNNQEFKDISSLILLKRVAQLLVRNHYRINNIDLIVMAEMPRMAPYYCEIKENYSRVLGLDVSRINIKATTVEKLGFIGRQEGIAAQAIVSLIQYKGR